MIPPFPLEHFEHGDVFFVQWIAFDHLQMHGLQAPLAGDGDFVWGQAVDDF